MIARGLLAWGLVAWNLVACGRTATTADAASPLLSPPSTPAPIQDPPPLPCDQIPEPAAPLYGYWGLNGYVSPDGLADVQGRLGMSVFHTATIYPERGRELLPMIRAAGARVTLRLTGDHQHYTTADGDFDLAAWKAMLDPWRSAGVQVYVNDGTLFGHMLLDDIWNFPGRDPTAEELDEMARYSQQVLPGLMTFVREKATAMPEPASGQYEHVDALVNQYRWDAGPADEYAASEAARARALGLRFINGLNIANGGDGSSGQPGWGPNKHAMSADEIARYGAALAAEPGMGAFLNWEYDGRELWTDGSIGSDYFDQPEFVEALVELGRIVKARPASPLRRCLVEGG